MPIGLIGILGICTIFYLLVAAGVIGAVGAQPVLDAAGDGIRRRAARQRLAAACAAIAATGALVCSKEALAWTLREIGWPQIGNLLGLAAGLALPSVILMMMFGQTRIFFVMSRDGLLPGRVLEGPSEATTRRTSSRSSPASFVALFAAFFPVGQLADISNSGTLFAFAMVSIAVMVLRRTDPEPPAAVPHAGGHGHRAARDPRLRLSVLQPVDRRRICCSSVWAAIGLVVYFGYSRRRSHVGRGIVEVAEHEAYEDLDPPVPGTR